MSLDRKYLIIGGTALVLVILVVLFSTIGSVNLSLGEIISSLIHQDNSMVMTIVYKMRLPRNILAVLIGANLAVSGVLLHLLTLELPGFQVELVWQQLLFCY